MITDTFDDKTESVIQFEAFYGPRKNRVKKCMILFSIELRDYMLSHYTCEKIAEVGACNGSIPVYSFRLLDEEIAFYMTPIGSALCSATALEAGWITGATQFVMFGSCGSLDGESTRGKYIVPTESYRDEGASYHYAKASDYIRIKNAARVAEIFTELSVPFVMGRNWTTDSMLRETKGNVAKRKAEGCISVEMELAGVQAAMDFYGYEVYDFLESGDVLMEEDYDVSGLSSANHSVRKLLLGMEILKRI